MTNRIATEVMKNALIRGCKKHPAYRAIREPRVDCEECKKLKMWKDLLIQRGKLTPYV